MEIKLSQPLGYSHIGRKEQQEDAVWPKFEQATKDDCVFVLCDGVGGSNRGEVASEHVSRDICTILSRLLKDKNVLTEEDVNVALDETYNHLDELTLTREDVENPPATTLTCVAFHASGVMVAHMGDSRIYQVRPGVGIVYQSADHSLVNALLQAGELTAEEAKDFPRKNVITRAIVVGGKRMKAEVHQLNDVQRGDYFFLCSDGVLEQLTNQRLVEILSMPASDKEKLRLIEAEGLDKTRDNYTAYLIPVDEIDGISDNDGVEEPVCDVVADADSKEGSSILEVTSNTDEVAYSALQLKETTKISGWLRVFLFLVVARGLISLVDPIIHPVIYENGMLGWFDAVCGLTICVLAIYVYISFVERELDAVFLAKAYMITIITLNILTLLVTPWEDREFVQSARTVLWSVVWLGYLITSKQVKRVIPPEYRKITNRAKWLVAIIIVAFIARIIAGLYYGAECSKVEEPVPALVSEVLPDGIIDAFNPF